MIRTVIHFVDSDTFGGSEQSLLHLLAGLDRARWRPVLLHHPEAGLGQLVEAANASSVTSRAVARVTDTNFIWNLPSLARAVGRERAAVFHAHLNWPLACKFGLLAARMSRVPAIVATAQLFVDALVNRSVRGQLGLISSGVDRYLAVSADVARRLSSSFGIPENKLRVVHNGIDPAPFDGRPDPDLRAAVTDGQSDPIVLTVARLSPQKGLGTLLIAASLVPHARFVIVGDGPDRAALEAQARSLGVADRVAFLGHRRDIPQLLQIADLFVLPSLFEGLPLAVLEAMAAGKPVVASRIGGTDEAVVDGATGLLIPPGEPTALAQAIQALLSDAPRAQRLGAAGRARMHAEFSAQQMVSRVEAAYDELLSGRAAG